MRHGLLLQETPHPQASPSAILDVQLLCHMQMHTDPVLLPDQTPAAFVQAWILEQFMVHWQTTSVHERRGALLANMMSWHFRPSRPHLMLTYVSGHCCCPVE